MNRIIVNSEPVSAFSKRVEEVSDKVKDMKKSTFDAGRDVDQQLGCLLTDYDHELSKVSEDLTKAKNAKQKADEELKRAQRALASTPPTTKTTDKEGNTKTVANPNYDQAKKAADAAKSKVQAAENICKSFANLEKALRDEQAQFTSLRNRIAKQVEELDTQFERDMVLARDIDEKLQKIVSIVSEYENSSI